MNLPNKLTILRIIFVPIMVIVSFLPIDIMIGFMPLKNLILLAIFCLASLTDYFDGEIARKRNMVTTFGKFFDPIADKLLIVTSYALFIEAGVLPAWVLIITEGIELIVAACRMLQAGKGKVVAASWYGKIKTVSQMIAIILGYLCNSRFMACLNGPNGVDFADGGILKFVLNLLFSIGVCVAVFATLFSGFDYLKSSKEEILASKW